MDAGEARTITLRARRARQEALREEIEAEEARKRAFDAERPARVERHLEVLFVKIAARARLGETELVEETCYAPDLMPPLTALGYSPTYRTERRAVMQFVTDAWFPTGEFEDVYHLTVTW